MKSNREKVPEWVDTVLRAHSLTTGTDMQDEPSNEFLRRCRTTALGSLELFKMKNQRGKAAALPGSFREHLETLASLAGVRLQLVLGVFDLKTCDVYDERSASGLTKLAAYLGLAREELILRFRIGLAGLTAASVMDHWPLRTQLARARRPGTRRISSTALEELLLQKETTYTTSERAALRNALNAVAEVYD